MNRRTAAVVLVVALGLLVGSAVAGNRSPVGGPQPMGGGGYDRSAPPVAVPTVTDPATKAKIAELEVKLAEEQKAMMKGAGGGNTGGGGYAEGYKKVQEIQVEIVRLTLGPADAAKYDEYQTKSKEVQKEQMELWQDKTIDAETRGTRSAELTKRSAALYQEYGEVTRKAFAIQNEITMRPYRRRSIEALKPFLKMGDSEWNVLAPKLEELVKVQGELKQLKGGIWSGFYVNTMRWQNPPATPEGAVIKVVKTDTPDAKTVKTSLDDLRTARSEADAKKKKDIEASEKKVKSAQDDVRGLLTVAQEAVLVVEGLLD